MATRNDPGDYAEALLLAIDASAASAAEKAHLKRMVNNMLKSVVALVEGIHSRVFPS